MDDIYLCNLSCGRHATATTCIFSDADGKLIQEQIVTPANGALSAKILSALIPAYREHSTVEHHHTGQRLA